MMFLPMKKLAFIAGAVMAALGMGCGGGSSSSSRTASSFNPAGPSPVASSANSTTTHSIPVLNYGGDSAGPMAVTFPPRDQSLTFRQNLEAYYRDVFRRSSQSSFVDIEGTVVWTQEYLRYRVNGCGHQEALTKVMAQIDGSTDTAGCSTASTPFPPRNEPLAFREVLEAKYRDGLRRQAGGTFVDPEGDVIWTQEYLRYRTTGCGDVEATNKVTAQLQGAPPPAGCSTTTVTTTALSTTPTTTTVAPGPTLQASFVMRQNGAVVNACNLGGVGASNCSLDGTGSTGSPTSYSWTTTHFRTSGGNVTATYSGATPSLGSISCTVQGNSQERLDVTLTVRNAAGQTSTLPQTLSFARAGCGT